jgi:carboxylate-amine ligase
MSTRKKEIKFLRTKIVELADKQGLIVGGAVHPFQNGRPTITDDPDIIHCE